MTYTGFANPADGEVYPFYGLNFNLLSPDTGVSLVIKVTSPDLSNPTPGPGEQTAIESVLASIASAVAALANVESSTTFVFRYDATSTTLDSD